MCNELRFYSARRQIKWAIGAPFSQFEKGGVGMPLRSRGFRHSAEANFLTARPTIGNMKRCAGSSGAELPSRQTESARCGSHAPPVFLPPSPRRGGDPCPTFRRSRTGRHPAMQFASTVRQRLTLAWRAAPRSRATFRSEPFRDASMREHHSFPMTRAHAAGRRKYRRGKLCCAGGAVP